MPRTEKPQARSAFAIELDRFRQANGLTQRDMADAVGVSQAAVSLWLSGKSVPSPVKVRLLEHYLGANVGELGELAGHKPASSLSWRKTTDVINEIRSRQNSTATGEIATAEDVALLLAGHTKKSFENLVAATERLRTVLGDAQKQMDALREAITVEVPGTPQFDRIVTQMSELSNHMAQERAIAERQQVDLNDVDKMTQRVQYVLGQSPLTAETPSVETASEKEVIDMTAQVLGAEGRRRGRTMQMGLRSAFSRWRHPANEDPEGALIDLMHRLVTSVTELQKEVTAQRAEIAELRGDIANTRAMAIVMG
jgi:transcriptional regulator with XRE-family HTH domain